MNEVKLVQAKPPIMQTWYCTKHLETYEGVLGDYSARCPKCAAQDDPSVEAVEAPHVMLDPSYVGPCPSHVREEEDDPPGPERPHASSRFDGHLPADANARKALPIATGVIDYFPDAIVAVAELSRIGNDQHNPGAPLHWDRSKSTDEGDALMRHFVERGTVDSDGVRHSTKVAWRALALLQKEIEASRTR